MDTLESRMVVLWLKITHKYAQRAKSNSVIGVHIITDHLKYNQDRIEHKITHNLDATLGSKYQQNIDLNKFLKKINIYTTKFKMI
jgi:hypothetical protein